MYDNPKSSRAWLSAYIYTKSPIYSADYDRELVREIVPLVAELEANGWCNDYFFVRYVDRGPHVRLRIRSIDDRSDDNIRVAVERCARLFRRAVTWEPYVPEYGRYGGSFAMPATERLFAASSRAALHIVLDGNPDDRPGRFGQALLVMVMFAYAITGGVAESSQLLHAYGTGALVGQAETTSALLLDKVRMDFDGQRDVLLTTVAELVEHLEVNGPELGRSYASYYGSIRSYVDAIRRLHDADKIRIGERSLEWRECVYRLSGSLMHMMNNRLGISIREESYVSLLAARAVDSYHGTRIV